MKEQSDIKGWRDILSVQLVSVDDHPGNRGWFFCWALSPENPPYKKCHQYNEAISTDSPGNKSLFIRAS